MTTTVTGRRPPVAGPVDVEWGTKAETLCRLREVLPDWVEVPRFCFFDVAQWTESPRTVLASVRELLGANGRVAIRSSSKVEDSVHGSHAGEFESILNVSLSDFASCRGAIEAVVSSMADHPDASSADQVLIQRFVSDVSLAGAATSHDLANGAPYYVVSQAHDTVSVTSGGELLLDETAVHHWAPPSEIPPRVGKIVGLLRFLGDLGLWPCEIEFAISSDDRIRLLQARHVMIELPSPVGVARAMRRVARSVRDQQTTGRIQVLSDLADWNPAEMIGQRPAPLSYSLYSRLITDSTWSEARRRHGYHAANEQLMCQVALRPMIRVDRSLASFVPASIPGSTRDEIVVAGLERVAAEPSLHRHLEFEVAVPSFTATTAEQIEHRLGANLDLADRHLLVNALAAVTRAMFDSDSDMGAAHLLTSLAQTVDAFCRSPHRSALGQLDPTVGGLPVGAVEFAMLARAAFAAEAIVRSLVGRDIISQARLQEFRRSVRTPASGLARDASLMVSARFAHLRPGTYDVRSRSLRETHVVSETNTEDLLIGADDMLESLSRGFTFTDDERREMAPLLAEGLGHDLVQDLGPVLGQAIAAREMGKFLYARSVSHILDAAIEWGTDRDIDRSTLAFLTLDDIRGKPTRSDAVARAADRRAQYQEDRLVLVPSVVVSSSDLDVVSFAIDQPTYVTEARAAGPLVVIDSGTDPFGVPVNRAIVATESADPGFDWIFPAGAAGLITCFGGANSHMAVRCHELGVPAAIGCGVALFNYVSSLPSVIIDPAAGILCEGTASG